MSKIPSGTEKWKQMIYYICLLTDDYLKGHPDAKCPPNQKVCLVKEIMLVGQEIFVFIMHFKKVSFKLIKYTDFTVKTHCLSSGKKNPHINLLFGSFIWTYIDNHAFCCKKLVRWDNRIFPDKSTQLYCEHRLWYDSTIYKTVLSNQLSLNLTLLLLWMFCNSYSIIPILCCNCCPTMFPVRNNSVKKCSMLPQLRTTFFFR